MKYIFHWLIKKIAHFKKSYILFLCEKIIIILTPYNVGNEKV